MPNTSSIAEAEHQDQLRDLRRGGLSAAGLPLAVVTGSWGALALTSDVLAGLSPIPYKTLVAVTHFIPAVIIGALLRNRWYLVFFSSRGSRTAYFARGRCVSRWGRRHLEIAGQPAAHRCRDGPELSCWRPSGRAQHRPRARGGGYLVCLPHDRALPPRREMSDRPPNDTL